MRRGKRVAKRYLLLMCLRLRLRLKRRRTGEWKSWRMCKVEEGGRWCLVVVVSFWSVIRLRRSSSSSEEEEDNESLSIFSINGETASVC